MTVVSPDRRVDLSLPDSVPLGDLIGQLLDVCTDHHDRSAPVAWMLRPVGGATLALASTLESSRVLDGAVLELLPATERTMPTTVEDVRDVTEDAVDHSAGAWTPRHSATMSMLVLAAVAVLVLARPSMWIPLSGSGLGVAGVTAALLLWAAAWTALKDLIVAAHGLLAAGLAWTAAIAFLATVPVVLPSAGLNAATRAGLCAAAVLAAASAVSLATGRLAAWMAASTVGVLAALGWAAMELMGRSADQAVALGSVVGVLSLGVLPRVSLAAGGLAGLDYRVRTRGSVEAGAVAATFARSRSMLDGALLATGALTASGSVRLTVAGSSVQLALGAAIACCLLLRARAFSQFRHVVTLVLAGTGALLGLLTADLLGAETRMATPAALPLVAVGSVLLAHGCLSVRNDVAGARRRRLLDVAESLAIATLIPLLAANLGVLDWAQGLVN